MEDREVIYAAYGSNLLKERFLVYIKGGNFLGWPYNGCKDKTKPIDLGWMWVPHRLYFAKQSPIWGGKGIAFLSFDKVKSPEYYSVVRLWKIKESQFSDINEQENYFYYDRILELGEKGRVKFSSQFGHRKHSIFSS